MIFGDLVHDPKFAVVSGALTACGTVWVEGADLVKAPSSLWPAPLPNGFAGFAHPRELKRVTGQEFPLEGRQLILHYDEYRSNIADQTATTWRTYNDVCFSEGNRGVDPYAYLDSLDL
jgi:hypothetical protein